MTCCKKSITWLSFSYTFSPLKNPFLFCFIFEIISNTDGVLSEFMYLLYQKDGFSGSEKKSSSFRRDKLGCGTETDEVNIRPEVWDGSSASRAIFSLFPVGIDSSNCFSCVALSLPLRSPHNHCRRSWERKPQALNCLRLRDIRSAVAPWPKLMTWSPQRLKPKKCGRKTDWRPVNSRFLPGLSFL